MRASSFHSKNKSRADCSSNQRDLFDHSVMMHATVEASALCINRAKKARCMMQTRQIRGLQIASQPQPQITFNETFWSVRSQTSSKTYAVTIDPPSCTCADFRKNAMECKHVHAVKYHMARESGETLPEAPELKRQTYRQAWHEYNLAATNEKARFLELLYALCDVV